MKRLEIETLPASVRMRKEAYILSEETDTKKRRITGRSDERQQDEDESEFSVVTLLSLSLPTAQVRKLCEVKP